MHAAGHWPWGDWTMGVKAESLKLARMLGQLNNKLKKARKEKKTLLHCFQGVSGYE